VPRLGCPHSRAYRGQVAHLSNDNHIRVVAKDMYQGSGEGFRVIPNISLPDEAFVVAEQEFNWIFNGDYISPLSLVKMIDHGC
jgi:hypothetical protein